MILAEIVGHKRASLAVREKNLPLEKLRHMVSHQPPTRSFAKALSKDGVALIAEVKKASPSKGIICQNFNPVAIARDYAKGGAAAISVLTEEKYFMGSLNNLLEIRETLGGNCPPLLRKDFIFDPYQLYEARAYGADCVLLIAAILSVTELASLISLSHQLELDCLVEVHNEAELETALAAGANIIGINNRNLKNFTVNLAVTKRLRPLIPSGHIVVSESGIKTKQDMERLNQINVNAALVGEALVSAADIPARIRELL